MKFIWEVIKPIIQLFSAMILSALIIVIPVQLDVEIPLGIKYTVWSIFYVIIFLLMNKITITQLKEIIHKRKHFIFFLIVAIGMPLMDYGLILTNEGVWMPNVEVLCDYGYIARTVLFYGIAVPLVEELVFRYRILNLLESKYGLLLGIIISSTIFGLLHIGFDEHSLLRFIETFSMGCILALVCHYSQSILCSFMVHCIWNIYSKLIYVDQYLIDETYAYYYVSQAMTYTRIVFIIVGICLFFGIIIMLYMRIRNSTMKDS